MRSQAGVAVGITHLILLFVDLSCLTHSLTVD